MVLVVLMSILLNCSSIYDSSEKKSIDPSYTPLVLATSESLQQAKPSREEAPPSQLRDWLSGSALFVSLLSLAWSIQTSRKTRKVSVQDDFWFRQVTYPLVIEPLLNFFSMQINNLPQDKSEPQDVQEYLNSFSEELERHRCSSALFPILLRDNTKSRDAYEQLEVSLDAVEDSVAEYCARLQEERMHDSDTNACVSTMRKELAKILDAVQKWHTSL